MLDCVSTLQFNNFTIKISTKGGAFFQKITHEEILFFSNPQIAII
jgi:hypothetical protein